MAANDGVPRRKASTRCSRNSGMPRSSSASVGGGTDRRATFILQRLMISSRCTAMNSRIMLRSRPISLALRRAVRCSLRAILRAIDLARFGEPEPQQHDVQAIVQLCVEEAALDEREQ